MKTRIPPIKRTILDTAEPLEPFSDEERKQLALQWVDLIYKRMTRPQQAYMKKLLSLKRGGQRKWTSEALKTLRARQQELQELGLPPEIVKFLLGKWYHLSEKSIANLLTKAKQNPNES